MGIEYTVTTVYKARDEASGTASKVGAAFDAIGGKIDAGIGKLGAFLAQAASVGAIAIGGGALMAVKKGLIDVNAATEEAQIGFATIFNTLGASNSYGDGLLNAKKLIADIRKDAAVLPGEFGDFVELAKGLAPALLQGGGGLKDIRAFVSDTASVGFALLGKGKGNIEMAGREMAELLEGRAGGHNKLGTRLGITTETHIGKKKFNEATGAERRDFLAERMKKAKDSLPAFASSWAGMWSNIQDASKQFLGRMTEPLFERIKVQMGRIGKAMGGQGFDDLADKLGIGLVKAFDVGVKMVEYIAKHWDEIIAKVKSVGVFIAEAFEKVKPLLMLAGKGIASVAEHPGEAAGMMAGARVATMLPGAADGLGGMLGIEGLGASFGALGLILIPLVGVFDLLTTDANKATGFLGLMASAAQGFAALIGGNVKNIFHSLVSIVTSLWDALKPVVDILGVAFMANLTLVTKAIELLLWPIEQLAKGIAWLVSKIPGYGDTTSLSGAAGDGLAAGRLAEFKGSAGSAWDPKTWSVDMHPVPALNKLASNLEKHKGGGKTSVTVNAPMTILSDSDPERLALKVSHKIRDELANPKSAIGLSVYRY